MRCWEHSQRGDCFFLLNELFLLGLSFSVCQPLLCAQEIPV